MMRCWLVACALCLTACANAAEPTTFEWVDGTRARSVGSALRVRWIRDLALPFSGAYVPVERASAALDIERARVFLGTSRGRLWALRHDGTVIYERDAGAAVEAAPAIDSRRRELYLANVVGEVQALLADDGTVRWTADAGGPVSRVPLLTEDAVYVVTDDDRVVAFARSDGSVLWRYRRERREGFEISGHAGLVLEGSRMMTAFTDGTVAALDASDGRVLWELDTSTEFDQKPGAFVDVDTTPAIADDAAYVASFSGGVYALDLTDGGVRWHEPRLTGVTDIAVDDDALLLASAQHGVVCLERRSHQPRWVAPPEYGAPTRLHTERGHVYVTDSLGALLALRLTDGREVGRLQTGHGIGGPASMAKGMAYVLSNAGRLFALAY
jgi:outer membrane protein assembly factor BamB